VNTSIPSLTLKSTVLALFAIMMSALALLDRPTDSASNTDAKVIAQLNPDHVQRIELSSATAKTILEKSELTGDWEITAPFTQDADSRRVSNLLAAFRSSVLADVTVDAGNLSEYGLDASNGLVVELWANDEAPVASFTIGKDLAGGSSFVRVSGDEHIYRARVGGRRRFGRAPTDWRNRVVVDREEADIQGLRVEPWNGELIHLVRGATEGETGDGPWTLDPDPGWGLDAEGLAAIVSRLGSMHAANILDDEFDGGFSPPAASITVMDKDGTEITLAIGRRQEDGVAFVRVAGRTGVYAVALADVAPFIHGVSTVSDMTMFKVDEADMDRLIYYQRRTKVELTRDATTGVWGVDSPAGLAVDVADIQFVVRQLSAPRGEEEAGELSDGRTGLNRPRMVFEVQRKDGSNAAIFVGRHFKNDQGAVFFWVRAQESKMVYVMSEPTLSRLRAGFGQH
jgi:hypothetical protein